jgi:D-3-phosphoglycerate dehydrogenase
MTNRDVPLDTVSAATGGGRPVSDARVLVLGQLSPEIAQAIGGRYAVETYRPPRRPVAADMLGKVEAVVLRSPYEVGPRELAFLPSLRVVVRAGSGLEGIDVDALRGRCIAFHRIQGDGAGVAELAFALLLNHLRDVGNLQASLQQGQWRKAEACGRQIGGKTLGIVGLGEVGRKIAAIASAGFDARVIFSDPSPQKPPKASAIRRHGLLRLDLDAVLAQSDYLFIACSLTPQTRGLIDADRLGRMKPDCVIVNVARGELLDEAAVLAALDNDRLGGACLDVFRSEPSPRLDLLRHPRVTATPHIGAQTRETMAAIGMNVLETLSQYLDP